MRRSVTSLLLLGTTFSLVPVLAATSAPTAGAAADQSPDFNGDGYADLAVGAQYENRSRGVVHVLYGSASGPTGSGSIVFGEDTAGVPGVASPGDQFGTILAHGNVNGDAYDDLVVGTPNDTVSGRSAAGSITLFRGSASGLRLTGKQFTDSFGPGTVRPNEFFGIGLALGDYDGDGDDDIAVGIPLDDLDFDRDPSGVGRVKILRSTNGGFSESNVWVVDRRSLPSSVRQNFTAGFGAALATLQGTADFDGLAIGMPEYSTTRYAVGAVVTYRGGASAMRYSDTFVGSHGTETYYGETLAAGDLTGDGNDDLAVGTSQAANGQGRVDVIALARDRTNILPPFKLSSSNAGHDPLSNDFFGSSVAIVDSAPTPYLYVGATGDEAGPRFNGGSVYVFVGDGNSRPDPHSTPRFTQPGAVRNGRFGWQITTLDASNDGFDDIVVTSDHTVNGKAFAGAVWYYDSNDGSPVTASPVEFNQDTPGVLDRAEENDGFGSTLPYL